MIPASACAASSLLRPFAISRQNQRSTSRRCDGLPGDFIADRPVNSFIQPAGLATATPHLEVLRRRRESALASAVGVMDQLDVGAARSRADAIRRASQTRLARMCDASCQPTTRRLQTSMTNAKNTRPSQQRR